MNAEQTENSQAEPTKEAAPEGQQSAAKYERSTIDFPYNDLDDAVSLVKAIHANAGVSCALDELAAFVRQSMTSGAFRLRVSNARTFGLTENERGKVRLTEIGRMVADPGLEGAGRVEAFLKVPLYSAIFEKFRGYTLPPTAALGREMAALGVSSKQTNKARQAFMRSARQAGFFAHGEDRLVKPSVAPTPTTMPVEPPATTKPNIPQGGSGNGDPPTLHPFIQGLLQTLPTPESDWPVVARAKWLQTAANIFDLIYKGEGGIRIEAAVASRSPRPNEDA